MLEHPMKYPLKEKGHLPSMSRRLPECVACAGQMVGASFGFDQLGTMLRSMQLCQTTRELRRLENMPLGSFDSSNMCFGRLTTNQVKGQSKPHHQVRNAAHSASHTDLQWCRLNKKRRQCSGRG